MGSYLPAIAPIIAIINSVIAVYATQFKPEEQRIKIILLVVAICLGAVAAVATVTSQYHINAKANAEKDLRTELRKSLGNFINAGNKILSDLQKSSDDSVYNRADVWYNSVVKFVTEQLGEDYVARLNDSTNLPPVSPTGATDDRLIGYWRGIYNRNARLVQFSSELSR